MVGKLAIENQGGETLGNHGKGGKKTGSRSQTKYLVENQYHAS
jgi:hypothetical protein